MRSGEELVGQIDREVAEDQKTSREYETGAIYGIHLGMSVAGAMIGNESQTAISEVIGKANQHPDIKVITRPGMLMSLGAYVGLPVESEAKRASAYGPSSIMIRCDLGSLDEARAKTSDLVKMLASVGVTDELLGRPVAESLDLYVLQ